MQKLLILTILAISILGLGCTTVNSGVDCKTILTVNPESMGASFQEYTMFKEGWKVVSIIDDKVNLNYFNIRRKGKNTGENINHYYIDGPIFVKSTNMQTNENGDILSKNMQTVEIEKIEYELLSTNKAFISKYKLIDASCKLISEE